MVVRWRDGSTARRAQVFLIVGGLAWIPARWGVMTTWDTTWLGIGYVGWNRLMLVPLTLLVAGAVRSARTGSSRGARTGWWIVAAGFAGAWIGVVVEFVVGGGLRGGPPALAMAGWSAYVLGTIAAGVGAAVVAAATEPDVAGPRRVARALAAGLAAVSMLAWPPLMIVASPAAGVIDQLVVGVAWVLVGLTAGPGRLAPVRAELGGRHLPQRTARLGRVRR